MAMAVNRVALAPGLYFLATPIGSARDITLRALDILASADVLFAEDTRTLRRLMEIHGIALDGRKLFSYHDHSNQADREKVLAAVASGKSVAYAAEAGTPMIADPGFQLGREVANAGHLVTSAPGASALLAALTNSGLGTDRFFFAGFAPSTRSARQRFLQEFAQVPGTLVFYESPKRVHAMLDDLADIYGGEREAVVARELTKKFEEVLRGSIVDLQDSLSDRTLKGEVVILVDRPAVVELTEDDIATELAKALETMSKKDAIQLVSTSFKLPRRRVYQVALELAK